MATITDHDRLTIVDGLLAGYTRSQLETACPHLTPTQVHMVASSHGTTLQKQQWARNVIARRIERGEAAIADGRPDRIPADIPDLPDYAIAIAVTMRDSEGHPDPAVRAARKVVVVALQGLHRVLAAATVEEVKQAVAREPGPGRTPLPQLDGRKRKMPAPLSEIRAWAQANGHTVSPRGRIAGHIVDAYEAAHPGGTA